MIHAFDRNFDYLLGAYLIKRGDWDTARAYAPSGTTYYAISSVDNQNVMTSQGTLANAALATGTTILATITGSVQRNNFAQILVGETNYYVLSSYIVVPSFTPNIVPSPSDGIFFKCKLAGEISDQDEYGAKNLLSFGNRTIIETLHNFYIGDKDLTPDHDDYVYVGGKWYVIDRVQISEYIKKEKTLGLARLKFGNNKITLSLVEIAVG